MCPLPAPFWPGHRAGVLPCAGGREYSQKHSSSAARARPASRRGPWGGGHQSGKSPVSAVKKVLAGRIETCALIYLCVCECECECVRVSNNRLQGLGAGPLSLFSVLVLEGNAGPSLVGRPCPWAPRLAGVSLWYDVDTLVCRGAGWGARSSHHLCNTKRKMAVGPQSCRLARRGAPLPGITTTLLGSICFRGHSPFFSVTSSMAISPR